MKVGGQRIAAEKCRFLSAICGITAVFRADFCQGRSFMSANLSEESWENQENPGRIRNLIKKSLRIVHNFSVALWGQIMYDIKRQIPKFFGRKVKAL